jgi:two-component system, response regulator PdtaR
MQTMLRVLVVEDDAMIASLLAETVEDLGHSVCAIAATQAEAVEQALICQPDLMIVDAGLSDGNGVAAVDTILKNRFVPHLFVTGDGRRVRALHPDAIILEKPFFVPELMRAIEKALAVWVGP